MFRTGALNQIGGDERLFPKVFRCLSLSLTNGPFDSIGHCNIDGYFLSSFICIVIVVAMKISFLHNMCEHRHHFFSKWLKVFCHLELGYVKQLGKSVMTVV